MTTHISPKSINIDLGSAEFKARAYLLLAEWAKEPPFFNTVNGVTQLIACRYEDVQAIFGDAETFSSSTPRGRGYEQFDRFMGSQFLTQMDGESHARLRRLFMPAFSVRRVAQIEQDLEQIFDKMLDDISAGPDEFDAVSSYATHFAVIALLTVMLKLTEAQKQVLVNWGEVQPLLTATKPGQPWAPEVMAAYQETAAVIREVIEERRARPGSDFVSDLVLANEQGDKLSNEELFACIFGVFAALATMPRSGSGALLSLYSHPGQLEQIVADETLLPHALEECFRYAGNGYLTFPRVATTDTVVGGVAVPKGTIVRPSPLGANYDPTMFPNPTTFDIHRKPRRIMTFGSGPHHCPGNILARKALTLAIGKFIKRFPDARIAVPDFVPEFGGAVGELRLKSLPLRK